MNDDLKYLEIAVEESRKSAPVPGSYRVGAVIVTVSGQVFKGYTHETGEHNHAEEEAVAKAMQAGATLRGATIYSSMEPCSVRKSKPLSCAQLIISHGFARAVYALPEPPVFVECHGAATLTAAGVEVRCFEALAPEVRHINGHLLE